MKRITLFNIFIIFLSFLLSSCDTGASGDRYLDDPIITVPGKWTIMVWLDGDNNLEPAALNDFNEMEFGLYNAIRRNSSVENNISVIVQIDRTSGYLSGGYDGEDDWENTRRYKIKPDSVTGDARIRSELLDDMAEVNMGDADNLKDFISYCKTNYPSDNYALILWNHGGGVKGSERFNFIDYDYLTLPKAICWDDTDGSDALYIGEIKDILTDTENVDFLGFDACLMGMAEVAYEYRPGTGDFSAEAMSASAANVQGDGWEYDRILNCFTGASEDGFNNPAITMSKAIVVEHKREFSSYSNETMAAYDLSRIEDVKGKLDALSALLVDKRTDIDAIRGSYQNSNTLEYFNEDSDYEWVNNPHFDLYDFASRVSSYSGFSSSSSITTAADNLKISVDECVVKSWGGSSYPGYEDGKNGLAFFLPEGNREVTLSSQTEIEYRFQWWYTNKDTQAILGSNFLYGKLDFCNTGSLSDTVETWKELLESWYDPLNDYPPDSY